MGHDVFVSHSSNDKLFADALVAHLECSGIRCWVAPRDILPGASWAGSILKAITDAKLMVLVFSGSTNCSKHVRREVERAVYHGIPVAPLRIADVQPTDDLEYFLSSSHWMDATTEPMEDHLARLAETIRAFLNLASGASEIAAPAVAPVHVEHPPVAGPALFAPPPVAVPTAAQRPARRPPWTAAIPLVVTLLVFGLITVIILQVRPASRALNSPPTSPPQPRVASVAGTPPSSPPASPSAELSPSEQNNSDLKPVNAGDAWTNSVGMTFVYIPAGSFLMGSPADEVGRFNNEAQHKVTLTRSFLMAATQVTQAQFKSVAGNSPSHFRGDSLPVEQVSYDDAVAFCNKLSDKEGKHYRLPTEAEWEYACRAGTTTAYYTGANENALDEAGWYSANSDNGTHPVGQKKPNALGLYDMHGNVWQWCGDWYGDYPNGDATDPRGPGNGTARVLRGGSWFYGPRFGRCANRSHNAPDTRNYFIGFRVVRELEQP
jgi:formylglycine-generating enzyme required for sulfatase activity